MNITGVMVQYYKSCPRELWFFAHKINMDYTDDNVQIGRQIHENAYSRELKSVHLGEVAIDVVKQEKDTIIFEIKKSRKLIEPAKYQLYYYLWYLKQIGKIVKGYLVY
ncbi:MAG: Dna2/Cas4 domain-containing protein, partial [Candidatus Micrarchaeia archaeon]